MTTLFDKIVITLFWWGRMSNNNGVKENQGILIGCGKISRKGVMENVILLVFNAGASISKESQ